MNYYYNYSRLQGQPDALDIAARLAYADTITNQVHNKQEKLTTLKRENAKLKQHTMVEGGGVNQAPAPVDQYAQASDRLRQTGRVQDAQNAVAAYLAKHGYIET